MTTANNNNLYGLVLAGGKSTRMGEDKALISWYGMPQYAYVYEMLELVCEKVYLSCREEQQSMFPLIENFVFDFGEVAGPTAGILSAFSMHRNSAWLVVACDLPLIDVATLKYLMANRNSELLATTFVSPHDGLPEPLITIWEPKAFERLTAFAAQGIKCPRKVLINSDVAQVQPLFAERLMNTNTPEDALAARALINNMA